MECSSYLVFSNKYKSESACGLVATCMIKLNFNIFWITLANSCIAAKDSDARTLNLTINLLILDLLSVSLPSHSNHTLIAINIKQSLQQSKFTSSKRV